MQTPMTVEGTDRIMAWDIASVRRRVRRIAEDAAKRAGMGLEEWLDEAIVEWTAGTTPEEGGRESRSHTSGRRRDPHSPRDSGTCRDLRCVLQTEEARARDTEYFLESEIARIERRMARDEGRAARAFETLAHILDLSAGTHDRGAAFTNSERSIAKDEPRPSAAPRPVESRTENTVPGSQENSLSRCNLDEQMEKILRGIGASRELPDETRSPQVLVPEKPRLDLEAAVSQIRSRRQALDAREARNASPSPRPDPAPVGTDANREGRDSSTAPGQGLGRNTGVHVAEAGRVPINSFHGAGDELTRPALEPPEPTREDSRAPANKMAGVWRERIDQRVSAADLTAMREQLAAMTRILSDLAPHNAAVGLEGAVRDLTERVAQLREGGHRESLLAPLDTMAAELRATLKSHDPQAVAAGLEKEIRALGGKIDELAHATINPETFERIRRQTEEVRNLLAAAAARAAPVERLERQISELADRVERLSASPAPHVESAQMAASLADVRREIERSTPLSALLSIESRLEQIAARLDREIARPAQDGVSQRPFEDLARRIDGIRQSLEARPQPQVDTSGMEALLKELSAKLASPNVEPLMTLMRDINHKFDAASLKGAEPHAIEPMLTEIIDKLDRLLRPATSASPVDMRSLEQALQSLHARLDLSDGRTFDRQIVSQIGEEVSRRIQDSVAGRIDAQGLADQIARIHDRLEALLSQFGIAGALESAVREVLNRLPGTGPSSIAGGTLSASDVHASVAEELAGLKATQLSSDRRIQLRLTEIQEVLQTLSAQFANAGHELASSVDDEAQSPVHPTERNESPASAVGGVEALGPKDPSDAGFLRREFKPAIPANEDESSPSQSAGDDVLLEPGAGAPQRAREARELARAIGSKTNPSVSAHIAAARRAAHSSFSEGAVANASAAPPPAGRGVERAKSLYANHKRSVLLAMALAIVVTVAARLIGAHAPSTQKSELGRQPPKAAVTGISPGRPTDVAPAIASAARQRVDTTPTASIAPSFEPGKANTRDGELPPELLATVPAGLSPFLRDAVIAGSRAAQYELAQRLFEGRGLTQDQRAAALWFERAASSGLAPAQFRIGTLYQKGVGVARDASAAKRWYVKAAEAGNARAAHNLAVMYAEPIAEKPDYAEAAKWFHIAGGLGVRDSQFNLAVLYARGLGVDQDLRQSWLWFSLAAAQGDADAGKKRDEVAAKMDPAALAAAMDELAKFKVAKPDPFANEVAPPPGGWDGKPGASPLGETLGAPVGGARPPSGP